MNRDLKALSLVALSLVASACASQQPNYAYGGPPMGGYPPVNGGQLPQGNMPPVAPSAPITPARCGFGVHFEDFSMSAMTQYQFMELNDYLRNAKCAKRPVPTWLLTETTWSYGAVIPSKGAFTMNGINIEFWEITR